MNRPAFTLIELLVSLAVMGVVFTVVGMAIPPAPRTPEAPSARQRAIASGVAQTSIVVDGDTARSMAAYPDGRVIADRKLNIDPLSGRPVGNAR